MNDSSPIHIRLMAEFSDSPIWGRDWDRDIIGMLRPEDFGIGEPLAGDLIDWNDSYANTVSPETYGWPTAQQAARHEADGLELVARLKEFLGDGYVVLYTDDDDPPLPIATEFEDGTGIGLAFVGRKRRRWSFRRRRA